MKNMSMSSKQNMADLHKNAIPVDTIICSRYLNVYYTQSFVISIVYLLSCLPNERLRKTFRSTR